MKPGDQFLMLYEVIRAARSGESYEGHKLNNFRNNLFWAKPVRCDDSYKMLICSDCMEMSPIPRGIVGANFSTVEPEDNVQVAKELAQGLEGALSKDEKAEVSKYCLEEIARLTP